MPTSESLSSTAYALPKTLSNLTCCILSALSSHGYHRTFPSNSKRREMRADRVRDIGRCKVRIVLFRHPRVGMAELLGNDAHRNAAHGKRRAVRVAKHME